MSETGTLYQSYILYRTAAKTYQAPSYKGPDGKTVTPPAVTSQAAGYVVSVQLLPGLTGIIMPEGFAYALDAAGAFPKGSIYTPATDYTLTGDATATTGSAVTLTLEPNNDGPTADTVVTLSDGDAGGTFSAETVTFAGSVSTSQTVTYTPKAAGTVTISATNNGTLANPASLNMTVSAAVATS
ncbi:MAG: hypothetical protein ABF876_05510 [Acetobacter aceti]